MTNEQHIEALLNRNDTPETHELGEYALSLADELRHLVAMTANPEAQLHPTEGNRLWCIHNRLEAMLARVEDRRALPKSVTPEMENSWILGETEDENDGQGEFCWVGETPKTTTDEITFSQANLTKAYCAGLITLLCLVEMMEHFHGVGRQESLKRVGAEHFAQEIDDLLDPNPYNPDQFTKDCQAASYPIT